MSLIACGSRQLLRDRAAAAATALSSARSSTFSRQCTALPTRSFSGLSRRSDGPALLQRVAPLAQQVGSSRRQLTLPHQLQVDPAHVAAFEQLVRDPKMREHVVAALSSEARRELAVQLVEAEEFDAVASDGSPCAHADEAFDALDNNKDGLLSRREFRAWYNSQHIRSLMQLRELAKREQRDASSKAGAGEASSASGAAAAPASGDSSSEEERLTDVSVDRKTLMLVMVRAMIPYIGFGICDNSLMILAGDVLDKTLGVTFCLSTLAAAGLGNLLSCTTGVLTGGFIERISYKFGIPAPVLTVEQSESKAVKNVHIVGSLMGISLGCLIGMFPLLLMDVPPNPHPKCQKHLSAEQVGEGEEGGGKKSCKGC